MLTDLNYTFVKKFQVKQILEVFAQIVHENITKKIMNIVEIYDDNGETSTFDSFKTYADDFRHFFGTYTKVYRGNTRSDAVKDADLVLGHNLSTDDIVSLKFLTFTKIIATSVPFHN